MLDAYRQRYPMLAMLVLFISGIIGAALIGLLAAFFSGTSDAAIRTAGGTLQVGGLVWVVRGLNRRATEHHAGLSWTQLKSEARAILGMTHPVSRSITVPLEAGAYGIAGTEARLEVTRTTLEGRVEQLEHLQTQDRAAIQELKAETLAEREARTAAVAQERGERITAISEVQAKIKKIEVGNIHLEWVGVIWVMLGLILATLAPELTSLLRR